MRVTANDLIVRLGLKPLPIEGGYFRETYRSETSLPAAKRSKRPGAKKPLSTAILYLLTAEPDCFSALHKLPGDELYHFYLGDPVEMLLLYARGRGERVVLGTDVCGEQRAQLAVPGGVWQGARLMAGGSFALLGTTMAPGFQPGDYVGGVRHKLIDEYPAQADLIRQLTRG